MIVDHLNRSIVAQKKTCSKDFVAGDQFGEACLEYESFKFPATSRPRCCYMPVAGLQLIQEPQSFLDERKRQRADVRRPRRKRWHCVGARGGNAGEFSYAVILEKVKSLHMDCEMCGNCSLQLKEAKRVQGEGPQRRLGLDRAFGKIE